MILLDRMEPLEIENLIAPVIPVNRMGLNGQGFADYMWFCCDNHRIQIERKQVHEVLGGMDSVEEQLQRELQNGVEETILLIEGICEPIYGMRVATQTWRRAKDKNILVPGRVYNCPYTGYKAWQNQLDKSGVTIVETFDYTATAMAIVALYQNSQKEEHKTLRRYIKSRIHIESPNPHVLTLMGIKGGGVGEEVGKAIIERYGTACYTLNQEPEDLAETIVGGKRLGINRAKKLLTAFGRRV